MWPTTSVLVYIVEASPTQHLRCSNRAQPVKAFAHFFVKQPPPPQAFRQRLLGVRSLPARKCAMSVTSVLGGYYVSWSDDGSRACVSRRSPLRAFYRAVVNKRASTIRINRDFLSSSGDKPISKPVQPVAPMVSTKVPSTAQPRPSPSASHGSAASHQRPASVHQPLAAAPCQVTVTVSPTSLQEKQSSMQPIASSMGPAALSLAQPGPTPAMMMSSPVVQTQAACSSNPSTPGPVGTDPGACAATPDRRMPQNFASESDKVIAGRPLAFIFYSALGKRAQLI